MINTMCLVGSYHSLARPRFGLLFEMCPWFRHHMETFSASLAICAGNSPVTGEFPSQRPVTRSFDAFFGLYLNKRLSKQSRSWWFEKPSRPLWRHYNVALHPGFACKYGSSARALYRCFFLEPLVIHRRYPKHIISQDLWLERPCDWQWKMAALFVHRSRNDKCQSKYSPPVIYLYEESIPRGVPVVIDSADTPTAKWTHFWPHRTESSELSIYQCQLTLKMPVTMTS